MSTKAQTAMSLSFGGDLEPFALTPSSADVISASLRTSTQSEVLEKRRTPIVSYLGYAGRVGSLTKCRFFCDGLQPELGFLCSWAVVLPNFSEISSL